MRGRGRGLSELPQARGLYLLRGSVPPKPRPPGPGTVQTNPQHTALRAREAAGASYRERCGKALNTCPETGLLGRSWTGAHCPFCLLTWLPTKCCGLQQNGKNVLPCLSLWCETLEHPVPGPTVKSSSVTIARRTAPERGAHTAGTSLCNHCKGK